MLESDRAVIFQGQGEQYAGMGKKLHDNFSEARYVFEIASEAADLNIAELCFEDPKNNLRRASYAQPAIVTLSLASYKVYEEEFGTPGHLAGHSLGEFSAAAASGAISIPDVISVVKRRGEMMEQIGEKEPGAMAAILGLTADKVREICSRAGVELANDNTFGQAVIAGLRSKVEGAVEYIKEYRGKFKLLPIDVASHCSLMEPVRENLKSMLSNVEIKWPEVPIISNVSARYAMTAEELRDNLSDQVAKTVRWRESVAHMIENGASDFCEIGPGRVLNGLVERIDPNVDRVNFNDLVEGLIKNK